VATVTARFSKVLGQTPVSSEPGEGALDHPAARQDDEPFYVVVPLDDLHTQQRHLCHRSLNLPRAGAAIGPNQVEPREAAESLIENETGPVTVLKRLRVDNDPRTGSPSLSTWILPPFTYLQAL
jgi:hypothetical protein